jgi:hypothetical protein
VSVSSAFLGPAREVVAWDGLLRSGVGLAIDQEGEKLYSDGLLEFVATNRHYPEGFIAVGSRSRKLEGLEKFRLLKRMSIADLRVKSDSVVDLHPESKAIQLFEVEGNALPLSRCQIIPSTGYVSGSWRPGRDHQFSGRVLNWLLPSGESVDLCVVLAEDYRFPILAPVATSN